MTWAAVRKPTTGHEAPAALVVPVSVFLIFVLLFSTFRSVRSAILILLNVPFAVIGGCCPGIPGVPLSVSAAIGFIALFGQAVLNGGGHGELFQPAH